MAKIKTHKATAKRFSITKNGKVKMNSSFRRHKLGLKTLAGKLNFLDLDDLLLLFGFFFALVALKAEFAVVHYAAYRRCSLRRNHNEIQLLLYGKLLCLRYRYDAYLLPVCSYKAHFGYFYLLIDEMFLLAYSKHLQK